MLIAYTNIANLALPPVADRDALLHRLDGLATLHAGAPAELRRAAIDALKDVLQRGRRAVQSALENGASGLDVAISLAHLHDIVISSLYEFVLRHVYPTINPTTSERLCLVAFGGYGRGELAPGSDIDLLFLRPYKQTPWGESVIEYMLYVLWDLGLKVGHATRSVDESLRIARGDFSVRTALLEARYLWGERELFEELHARFWADLVAGEPAQVFVEAKLAERDARHRRLGDSRYVVEPNIKDGKGGLRDLHTLFWIAKYVYRVENPADLVQHGLLTRTEYQRFEKAERFLWTVRCHLHFLTGRAEERLTFDLQPEIARRLGYTDHAGTSGVERFMKHYFLIAKDVGDLTRIFCAVLEEQHKKRRPSLGRLFLIAGRRRQVPESFALHGGRLDVADAAVFKQNPVDLIRLFHTAQRLELEIHPHALRLATRCARFLTRPVQEDPEANRLFLEILTSRQDPETALRRMNEAGVLGRFVPDFGRIVAQMQFNMYHHYTVDEHLIRAIGVLARIEAGELAAEHPLASELMRKGLPRAVLYVATLLHDIAKGRRGDHSEEGEAVARRLCPRLGMSPAETETVAWLVRHHLVLSDYAQKRDITDAQTVANFAAIVRSLERLRLLLVMTEADIRAVGPGVFNGWKGQLLRQLYYEAEAVLLGGHDRLRRSHRVAAAQEALRLRLTDWPADAVEGLIARHYDAYWLSADADTHAWHARLMRAADEEGRQLHLDSRIDRARDVTEIVLYTQDHPGLFARVTGAFSVSGANILDAKVFTTADGMALDTFYVQDSTGHAFTGADKLDRLAANLTKTLAGEVRPREVLARRKRGRQEEAFTVEPRVIVDNEASNTHTVLEINGRDRPGLLADLAWALYRANLSIGAARIATYGELAVDVFYVKDLFGLKITNSNRLKAIEERLKAVLAGGPAKREDTPAAKRPQDAPAAR